MNDSDHEHVFQKKYVLVGQKAIILNDKGELLLLQRSQRSGQGGKWSLPGGALEDNESPIEGISREIHEETEMKVSNISPFSVFSYTNKDNDFVLMIGYQCFAQNQEFILNWEHNAYKWVTQEEALQMDLGEHARFFIEQFDSKKF